MNILKTALILSSAVIFTSFASTTLADKKHHKDFAKVISATPLYHTVEHRVPRESCWMEAVRVEQPRQHNSKTSTILGGIIGGAIGNAVGAGDENKKVGTVVGSILGMSVGNDIGRRHHRDHARNTSRFEQVERCETSYDIEHERKLTGYNVVYKYYGKRYTTRMSHDPGDKIRVAVTVKPIRY